MKTSLYRAGLACALLATTALSAMPAHAQQPAPAEDMAHTAAAAPIHIALIHVPQKPGSGGRSGTSPG